MRSNSLVSHAAAQGGPALFISTSAAPLQRGEREAHHTTLCSAPLRTNLCNRIPANRTRREGGRAQTDEENKSQTKTEERENGNRVTTEG